MQKTGKEIRAQLADPFGLSDIEWRVQRSGISNNKPWAMVLAYVTNRAIQNRLDDVVGIFGWSNKFTDLPGGGVECTISILNHKSGEWISKSDAAPSTDIEAVKGGRSGAMKRAAYQWGIGRYLYDLEANFANCFTDKRGSQKATFKGKDGNPVYGSWEPPRLPEWALPSSAGYNTAPEQQAPQQEQAPVSTANPQQMKTINAFLSENGLDVGDKLPNVLAFISKQLGFAVDSVSKIPADRFNDVFGKLKAKVQNDTGGEPKAGVKMYPADLFDANFVTWESLIKSGKKTAADIISLVTSKGQLTEDQLKKINGVKK